MPVLSKGYGFGLQILALTPSPKPNGLPNSYLKTILMSFLF